MLFSGFLFLFFTVIFADGISAISAKYASKEALLNSNEIGIKENILMDENLIVIAKLLDEKVALNEEESETTTCGQLYKDCIGKIDNEQPYNDVCSQTLQCTADYFECRMNESNSTSKVSPTRHTYGTGGVVLADTN